MLDQMSMPVLFAILISALALVSVGSSSASGSSLNEQTPADRCR
jgi:hypothetical protein